MQNEKVAVVTGSTSGIGLGIAKELAKQGCNVVLNARKQSAETDQLCNEIKKESGVNVMFGAADMSSADQISKMMAEVDKKFGRIDIVVNNAGIQHVAHIEDFPNDKWDQVVSTNLSSAFHTTKAVIRGMKDRKWGRIVNISSAHGLVASPFKSAYVAAKHGMVGLTKVTALELAEFGITCNAVCPGYVYTPLVEKQIDDQAKSHGIPRENVIKDIMLVHQFTKRFVEVDEVAKLTAFLCSDAAGSITGAAIPIEGGWVAN
ncbi:MAG: 3-hydroxybutyrate dehydrogenase [Alphaproteobacteria bacterium]|nr:3-hydroxybutyrate dehydrogenase [Alphaproteobacteria bacterium]